MRLIANGINNSYLREVLPDENDGVDAVCAVIAYGSSDEQSLLNNCLENRLRLDIWMRYDETVPVSTVLLRRFLSLTKRNVFCYQVPDVLHSKVIWWKGYGVYIGSANLSSRAWVTNIEAGLFALEADLSSEEVAELELFFERLNDLEAAFELSEDVIAELEGFQKERKRINDLERELRSKRKRPIYKGPNSVDKGVVEDKKQEKFQNEWNSTLAILKMVSEEVVTHRPDWVSVDSPAGWQADQFLHAFYYNRVKDGRSYPFEDCYQANKNDPGLALNEAMTWWRSLKEAPSSENETFDTNAPYIRAALAEGNINDLSVSEFQKVIEYTHATSDHVSKIKLSVFGISDVDSMTMAERLPVYTNWLWRLRNKKGMSVLGLLNYVMYEGSVNKVWERLYSVKYSDDYSLPHYGLNSVAEVIGWARPEDYSPRNGRTSKALRALGYNVKVHQ